MHRSRRIGLRRVISAIALTALLTLAPAAVALAGGGGGPWPK